jgi:hypothetical protein
MAFVETENTKVKTKLIKVSDSVIGTNNDIKQVFHLYD